MDPTADHTCRVALKMWEETLSSMPVVANQILSWVIFDALGDTMAHYDTAEGPKEMIELELERYCWRSCTCDDDVVGSR